MVAAASQIPTALSSSAAGAVSPDAAKAIGAPGNDIADNEFMQLLSTLIKPDADSSNQSVLPGGKAEKETPSKDDSTANATDVPPWLMVPPVIIPNVPPTTPSSSAQSADGDETDALTPVSNAATNALLAQNLKRLGDNKSDVNAKADKGDAKSELPSFLGKDVAASPLDVMLKSVASTADNAASPGNKIDTQRVDSDNSNASSIPMMSLHQAVSDTGEASVQIKVESRIESRQWADEIGNHLSVLVANKSHSASLQLTPENLGPVQVKIEVNSNQANVWFTADHPDTRTALEQSLPRLRELFASQGMSLMDAGVFSQGSQQQAPMFSRGTQPSYGMTDMSTDVTSTQVILKVGLLDTYA